MLKQLALMGILLLGLWAPGNAHAKSCIQSQVIGTWLNPFAGAKSDITKLEVWAVCESQSVPHIKVKAYTACAPRDCTWGRAIAKSYDEQSFEVMFRTFFAKRTISASINGRRMDVKVFDNFHDPRKMDATRSFVLWRKKK